MPQNVPHFVPLECTVPWYLGTARARGAAQPSFLTVLNCCFESCSPIRVKKLSLCQKSEGLHRVVALLEKSKKDWHIMQDARRAALSGLKHFLAGFRSDAEQVFKEFDADGSGCIDT